MFEHWQYKYNEADATDHWKIVYVNIKIISCLRIKNHDIDWKHGRHLMGLQSSSVIFLIMFKTFAVGWIFFLSGELNAIRAKLNFIIAYMWASPLHKFSIPIWSPNSLWHKDKNCKTRKNDSEQSDCKRQISKKTLQTETELIMDSTLSAFSILMLKLTVQGLHFYLPHGLFLIMITVWCSFKILNIWYNQIVRLL